MGTESFFYFCFNAPLAFVAAKTVMSTLIVLATASPADRAL